MHIHEYVTKFYFYGPPPPSSARVNCPKSFKRSKDQNWKFAHTWVKMTKSKIQWEIFWPRKNAYARVNWSRTSKRRKPFKQRQQCKISSDVSKNDKFRNALRAGRIKICTYVSKSTIFRNLILCIYVRIWGRGGIKN